MLDRSYAPMLRRGGSFHVKEYERTDGGELHLLNASL
jgi:hypothetical protein